MEVLNRKRPHSRQPLKETSGNVPSPHKKQMKVLSMESNNALQAHPIPSLKSLAAPAKIERTKVDKPKQNRLEGDEFVEWRNEWRRLLKNSVVYFDTQGCDTLNTTHVQEQKRASKGLRHFGSVIVPFYERDVTIIVSRRPYSLTIKYPSNDIFSNVGALKIKIWNYDKVFRFLKNMGLYDEVDMHQGGDLVNLLKEEKIFGSTDKDPNAKREDLHYLESNYLYVYDLSQSVRPIAIREWLEDDYPKFCETLDGKCPFIPDSENLERKKLRRLKKFDDTEAYRKALKQVADELVANKRNRRWTGAICSTSSDHTNEINELNENSPSKANSANNDTSTKRIELDNDSTISQGSNLDSEKENKVDYELPFKHPKPSLVRNSSCLPNNSNSRFYDVAASGYNGTSNAVLMSIDSGSVIGGGNGLGPNVSQVPSKNLNNLKRRIFMKKQRQRTQEERAGDKEHKPGYCENCRIKFNNFEDHINASRHRRFALDDDNFKDIDNLIKTLNENKSFGFVTSDGDYSITED